VIAALLGFLTFALHIAFAGRYGLFRDELYFLACAQHLAAGYVDQPSFTPAIAWIALHFSGIAQLFALRVFSALAIASTVYLSCRIVAYMGGGSGAQLLAGICTACSPLLLLTGGVLTTTGFDPLTWTLLGFIFLRMLDGGDDSLWIPAGIVLGLALWAKYTVLSFFIAFVLALLAGEERKLVWSPRFAQGAAAAVILIAPNAIWQFLHGLPILAVAHGDLAARHPLANGMQLEFSGWLTSALAFLAGNLLLMGVPGLVVGLAGWNALGAEAPWRRRPLAFAIALLLLFGLIARAKPYYVGGLYPLLFACGATYLEAHAGAAWRRMTLAGVLAVTLLLLPFLVPVLPLQRFIAYGRALGVARASGPAVMQPLYADELDWERAVAAVAQAYHALPERQQTHTAIFADSYAYAGAIERYGPRYGLPVPIGGNNSFWLWGPRDYDGSSVIAVGATQYAVLQRAFGSVRMIAVVRSDLRSVIEGPLPIYLCTRPRAPLSRMWPMFRYYGA
jgi:4-amino-4-deoxy-L-arabinose transferase-like glycosyltransferase